jgi:putative transposase
VRGHWHYPYRAVDKAGHTIDCLLTTQRDRAAALRFPTKAIRRHGVPETITVDGSETNPAAVKSYNATQGTAISIRQVRYLNKIVEQDHRAVQRVVRPMLGGKFHETAQHTFAGIELMHMLKKRQPVTVDGERCLILAGQFYALAAYAPTQQGSLHHSPKFATDPLELPLRGEPDHVR